jgi:hypothetical protein
MVKALIVFGGALLISWSLSAVLRRLPIVRMLLGEGGGAITTRRGERRRTTPRWWQVSS